VFHAFFKSREWAIWAYGGGALIILLLWIQVQTTVAINGWYGAFYDLLQNAKDYYDKPEEGITKAYELIFGVRFLFESDFEQASFLVIAMPYVFLFTFTNFFVRHYIFRWRQAMTYNYIPRWETVEEEIEGASQRIQEDCYKFASIVESLGQSVVRATMTLIAFIPILWELSNQVVDMPIFGNMEGSLVWLALILSVGGLTISWFVGIKLPGLEYNNQRVEAAFRKQLVYGEDNKTQYAKSETLFELFIGIRFNYFRLFLHYGYFDVWLYSYLQALVVLPMFFTVPSLITGAITLGVFQQINNAFDKVHDSFSVFLHRWTTITELRSIYKRLHEFEGNLKRFEKPKMAQAD